MDAETLDALDASIERWDEIAANGDYSTPLGCNFCPLCALHREADCRSCPVFEVTGYEACLGTPYHDVVNVRRAVGTVEHFRQAAAAEALFLRSLRPIGSV